MLLTWILIALILAVIPATLLTVNLPLFQAPPLQPPNADPPCVSVLIPARNEESHIQAAAQSVLANQDIMLELIILDDHSTDNTAAIIQTLAQRDARVKLPASTPLPEGWCGKQHACWTLAQHAQFDLMVFMDADVELAPDALIRMATFMNQHDLALGSGFPQQKTETFYEKLLIPLMHFILLGFLPIRRMRNSNDPAYSAGCGQLFIANKSSYMALGGHSAIRASRHDGITLPRAFRKAGFVTDLFDATHLASCRMYQSASQVFNGLAKNATEALAAPKLIVPATLILLGGQVMPLALLIIALLLHEHSVVIILAVIATALSYWPRLIAAFRFRQSMIGAMLHPLGISLLVFIQWYALARHMLGKPIAWRGRT
ncbi:MAG: glycosyltransferase family 2 protein [Phycisphaerae bacterium]